MMDRLKLFVKNSRSSIAAVLATVLAFTVIFSAMIVLTPDSANADDEIPVIPSKIGFAGETYSSSNKLKILEVVPTLANCELSYMADCGPVTLESALAITDANKFVDVMKAYVDRINNIDGGKGTCSVEVDFNKTDTNWTNLGNYLNSSSDSAAAKMNAVKNANIRFCNTNGGGSKPYVYKTTTGNKVYTRNFLAYAIFGCYDMCDKLEVVYATPDQLVTEGDSIYNINKYKLIYFNVSHNVSFSQTLYNKYNNTNISTGTFDENHNFSGNVTWNIYHNVINNNQAIMFDRKSFNGDYKNNLDKLYALIFGIDRDTFENKFMTTKPANNSLFGVYEGEWGKFDTEKFELYYRPTKNQSGDSGVQWASYPGIDTAVSWNNSMFMSASYNPYSPTYSADTAYYTDSDGVKHTFVNIGRQTGADVIKNVFVENGDNILGNSLIPSEDKTPIDPNRTNTSNEELAFLFGDRDNKVRNAYIIQYILGLFSSYSDILKHVNVLEIEPGNSFYFSNDSASAAYILENYLDKSTALGITVDVTQTTMNGFISMTEDIAKKYDLVILGNKFYKGNTATDFYLNFNKKTDGVSYVSAFSNDIQKLILEDNKKVSGQAQTISLSGNDITEAGVCKLYDYIRSGKPLAIGSAIFGASSGSGPENIYRMSEASMLSAGLDLKNVIKIKENGAANDSGKTLSLMSSPSISINEAFFCTYNGSNLAQGTNNDGTYITVDDNRVYLNFNANNSMQIGSARNQYKLSVYLDSDGNGLITESDTKYNFIAKTNGRGYVTEVANSDTGARNDSLTIPFSRKARGYMAWKITCETAYDDDTVIIDGSKMAASELSGKQTFVDKNGNTYEKACAVVNSFAPKQGIDVLQIIPVTGSNYSSSVNYLTEQKINLVLTSNTSDASYNSSFYSYFKPALEVAGIKSDEVNIKVVTIDEFEGKLNTTAGDKLDSDKDAWVDKDGNLVLGEYLNLDDYKMVIFGFADNFNGKDLSNPGAINALYTYIDNGNAVLLSHDTIIYKAYSNSSTGGGVTNVKFDEDASQTMVTSFNLTSKFRYVFGMDRYAISDSNFFDTTLKNSNNNTQGFSNLFSMKYASVAGGALSTDKEYKMYSGMTSQGWSNSGKKFSVVKANQASSVNSGQITDFPYKISETISTAETHSQWYQLNLDATCAQGTDGNNHCVYDADDTVVWYTLANTDNNGNDYYAWAGNDALNNYYIYSKNNITYTGFGHSGGDKVTAEEYKLFVNTIIKALSTAGNPPEIVVTSAEKVTGHSVDYVQKIRKNDYNNGNGTSIINFRVEDEDLGTGNSTAIGSGAYVYWDCNKNGKYDATIDIDISNYVSGTGWSSNHTVYPATVYSIDLKSAAGGGFSFTDGGTTRTFEEFLEQEDLWIGIVAKKGSKAGKATVQCVYTDVFPLD